MKKSELSYRLTTCLAIFLTFCCPFEIAASKTDFNLSQVEAETKNLTSEINSFFNSKDSCLIKINCKIPLQANERAVAKLLQRSLFQGSLNKDRTEIIDLLDKLGFDIDAFSHFQVTDQEQVIQFSLSKDDQKFTSELLNLLKEVVLLPQLIDDNIELARLSLLEHITEDEEASKIKNVTFTEVRDYYKKWYLPENMSLVVVGYQNEEMIQKEIEETFDGIFESIQFNESDLDKKEIDTNPEEIFTADTIALATDNKTYVIDGKIWMDPPNWINKEKNGKQLGVILTAFGITGMILAFPAAITGAIIGSTCSMITGIYFLSSSYLKDPKFVETARNEDLQKGFSYAYRKGRAGITLTPYERRFSFLQEMVDRPHLLPKLPILLLADDYELNDPVIAQLFTIDEYNVLTNIKRNFIHQRNNYKIMKENLESELSSHLAPFARLRDNSLQNAKEHYERNQYVSAEQSYITEKAHTLKEIEESFKKSEITINQKNDLIVKAENQFINSVNSINFQNGLTAAKEALRNMQFEIQNAYDYQAELCKQRIQYNERKALLDMGHQATINYFSQQLQGLLAAFPVCLPTLADYLDLRGL